MKIDWINLIGNNAANFPVVAVFILLVILSTVSIAIYYLLSKRVTNLENNYAMQSEFIVKTRAKFLAIQQDINRLLRIAEPNADNIENLQQRMAQIEEVIGTVMGASDFLESGFDSTDRVEIIRERIKWERERKRLNQINESDFYES